jgi:peptide methionine sulfoxide reductase msrA/msrB
MEGTRIGSEEKEMLSTYIGVILFILLIAAGIYFYFLTTREIQQVTGFDPNRPIPTDEVLRRRLGGEGFAVVREGRTQMPFQNEYWNNQRPGLYVDAVTGEPLFTSVDKYDAGVGMPSFTKPISTDLLVESLDTSHDMQRTRLQSKRSKAYLGHRFDDPKSASGQRYSVNSASLRFVPIERMRDEGYGAYLPLVEGR